MNQTEEQVSEISYPSVIVGSVYVSQTAANFGNTARARKYLTGIPQKILTLHTGAQHETYKLSLHRRIVIIPVPNLQEEHQPKQVFQKRERPMLQK